MIYFMELLVVVLEYVKENGVSPFSEWISGLDGSIRYRVQARIFKLKDSGHFGFNRRIAQELFELKFKNLGGGIRIYYGIEEGNRHIILLFGGNKSKQSKDIVLAKTYWQDFKSRKTED